jgi:hypothetical protein
MKSVKFWRENPANKHSISSGKFRLQKIREIRSSQFMADCSRVESVINRTRLARNVRIRQPMRSLILLMINKKNLQILYRLKTYYRVVRFA